MSLPEKARAKLLAISGVATDARAAAASANGRRKDLLGNRGDPEVEIEIARLTQQQAHHDHRYRELSGLAAQITQWLTAQPPSAKFEITKSHSPEIRKGETLQRAVARVRAEIVEVQQQLRATRSAAMPKDDAKVAARAYVDALIAKARPSVKLSGGALEVDFSSNDSYGASTRRAVELMAWLHPEQFVARLEAEIDALPEAKVSMSAEAKRARAAELVDVIDQLERDEEALIAKAEADGIEILRRATASPLAVLCLRRAA